MNDTSQHSKHVQKTMYFSDGDLMRRFFSWCSERRIAPGSAVQSLLGAFMADLELQRHQVEITLPIREVKF